MYALSLVAEATSSVTSTNEIIIGLLAFIPATWGAYTGWKSRKDQKDRSKTQDKIDLSRLGADILREEVKRLSEERERWERDRESWFNQRNELVQKFNDVADKLDRTNQYLYLLVAHMRASGVEPPAVPSWMLGADDTILGEIKKHMK